MGYTRELIKLEELEKRLNSLNKSVKDNNNQIISMSDYISCLNEIINMLKINLDTLFQLDENYISYMASYSAPTMYKGTGSIRPERIYFLCKPGIKTFVKIKLDVELQNNTGADAYFRILLNAKSLTEGIVYEEKYKMNGTLTKTIEHTYEFVPEKEANNILIVVHSGESTFDTGRGTIFNFNIEIVGYNVVILTRDFSLRLFITKNNYYIAKNLYGESYYGKFPIDQVSLTDGYTKAIEKTPPISGFIESLLYRNVTYLPNIVYDSETDSLTINDEQNTILLYSYCFNNYIIYTRIESPFNVYVVSNNGFAYTLGHPYQKSSTAINVASAQSNKDCELYVNYSITGLYSTFLYDNKKIGGVWVENCAVFAKDWEDHVGERLNHYIAVDENANIYFFNSYKATYQLFIGKGHQVNAYMQSDLSINVYYRWLNDVYKKVLTYNNDTGQYQVENGETKFENAWEYLEGYGNDYFINRLGTWEYVNE